MIWFVLETAAWKRAFFGYYCYFLVHFRFVLVHFETNLFVSVCFENCSWKESVFLGAIAIIKVIFGLFRFILKQICLFQFFQNTFKTPKHTETKFSLVSKMNRNKRETDPVSVIFGSNLNFFLFVLWTWMYTVKISWLCLFFMIVYSKISLDTVSLFMVVYRKRSCDTTSFSWMHTVKDLVIQPLCSWMYRYMIQ